tara:strand:- start:1790 stop:2194 length:405 start_codon:yes stop_codon:yes gene_type:complete
MNDEAKCLQKHIDDLSEQLQKANADLKGIQNGCYHDDWSIEYTPDYQSSYRIPSDKECGRKMGVDSLPPVFVPSKTTAKWIRTCPSCGKVETTEKVRPKTIPGEIPGTTSVVSEPDFYRQKPSNSLANKGIDIE